VVCPLLFLLFPYYFYRLVKRASDWQYSSIHRYIKLNILDKNWGDGEIVFADDIGYE